MSPKPPVPSGNSEENVIHLDRSKVQHSSDPGDWNWPLLITIKTEVLAILAEFHPPQKQQAFCTSRIGFIRYRIRFKRWCWGVGAENRIKQYLRLNNRKRKCFRLQVSASTLLQECLPGLLDVEVCHRVLYLQDCKDNDFKSTRVWW